MENYPKFEKTPCSEHFKLWIKEIRRRLGLTQMALALKCGVSVGTVQSWELKAWPSGPSFMLLNQLAESVKLKPFQRPPKYDISSMYIDKKEYIKDQARDSKIYFNESDAAELVADNKTYENEGKVYLEKI